MIIMVAPLRWSRTTLIVFTFASALLLPSCGGSGSSGGGGGQQPQPPAVPTGLTATGGNQQVALAWNASSGATSYNVGRATTTGGPYMTISSPTTTSYTDSAVTNGTPYYYVVSAVNPAGESANSSQVSATPSGPVTSVSVTIDVLANRHTISPYIYGGAFPQDAPTITDSGLSVVRWGGNAASTYNWQLGTNNADNDYYFEDFAFDGFSSPQGVPGVSDSIQWIGDVKAAGGTPLMTMVMLPWVAQSAEVASPPELSLELSKYKLVRAVRVRSIQQQRGEWYRAGNLQQQPADVHRGKTQRSEQYLLSTSR